MPTVAGILCVRDGFKLDYCWQAAGQSLLGFCDELVLSDCDSSDGTREAMDAWKLIEPRINICNFPWTDPKGDKSWWPTFLNYARQHAKSDYVVCCDADEIVHEDSYEVVRKAAESGAVLKCHRYNFWHDAQHLIPEGFCCGTEVIRCGPANMFLPSDYPDPRAEAACSAAVPAPVHFYHYGFLRERKAFFRKAREVHRIWHNSFDDRLEAAEKFEGVWSAAPGVTGWENNLVEFKGTHPKAAHAWLRERGYDPRPTS